MEAPSSLFYPQVSTMKSSGCGPAPKHMVEWFGAGQYIWSEHDTARWKNSIARDFTVNAYDSLVLLVYDGNLFQTVGGEFINIIFRLMFDPFKKVLFDYVGAKSDLDQRRVRLVC